MDIEYTNKKIVFNKELRIIDQFVFSFIPYLDKSAIRYVLISGYVFLFFGRDRSTEDIDMFVENMPYEKFLNFWNILSKEFDCMNSQTPGSAYDLFSNGGALRFHKKDSFIPNMEFKPLKTALDDYSLDQRIEVNCNGEIIYISPLELQVAFKLWLGSEKDEEDARFLYKLLKEHLNKSLIREMMVKLGIPDRKFEIIMGEKLE